MCDNKTVISNNKCIVIDTQLKIMNKNRINIINILKPIRYISLTM